MLQIDYDIYVWDGKMATDDSMFPKNHGFFFYIYIYKTYRSIPVIAMSRRIFRDENGLYRRIWRRKRRVLGRSMKFAPWKCRLMRAPCHHRKPDSNISSAELGVVADNTVSGLGWKKFLASEKSENEWRIWWKFVRYRADKFVVINKYLFRFVSGNGALFHPMYWYF